MIEGDKEYGYFLLCDNCGDDCDEIFDTLNDAVEYKTDRDNGWTSVKDKDGDWQELCPSCNQRDVIAKIKGIEQSDGKFTGGSSSAFDSALKGLEDL